MAEENSITGAKPTDFFCGDLTRRFAPPSPEGRGTRLNKPPLQKLDVRTVLEEELQVFGVEAELGNGTANFISDGCLGGRASPAIASTGVLEFDRTAVAEIQ